MAKKTSGSLGFEKIVRPPYAQYLGVEMEVPGSWWPNTKGKEATKMFKVKVVDVQEQHVPTGSGPGAAGSVHMKVVLLSTSDPNLSGAAALVEDIHYWWVSLKIFSKAYFANKEDIEKKKELKRYLS